VQSRPLLAAPFRKQPIQVLVDARRRLSLHRVRPMPRHEEGSISAGFASLRANAVPRSATPPGRQPSNTV
jgi:hypothetical protein